jgi:hypothetical protein
MVEFGVVIVKMFIAESDINICHTNFSSRTWDN